MNLSKHPIDWILHGVGCFLCVASGAVTWWAMIILAAYLEYEQKNIFGYHTLSWKNYIINHSVGDMLANLTGIALGYMFPYIVILLLIK